MYDNNNITLDRHKLTKNTHSPPTYVIYGVSGSLEESDVEVLQMFLSHMTS